MKILYKTKLSLLTILAIVIAPALMMMNSCVESQKIAAKSGAQLWAENCQRCHNTPSHSTFSSEKWETIVLHIQSRALLTEKEKDKIVDFLKQ
jgi:hypothetical protein